MESVTLSKDMIASLSGEEIFFSLEDVKGVAK